MRAVTTIGLDIAKSIRLALDRTREAARPPDDNMGSFWFGSGQAGVVSLFARHVQKFIGAFAFGIDSEKL
jgi:hypothetical protein